MLRVNTYAKGVSGFITFTVLLAISSALALYIYASSSNLYLVYKPKRSYVYGYAICYNMSTFRLVVGSAIDLCEGVYGDYNNTMYLCIFRVDEPINLTIVYRYSAEVIHVNRRCTHLSRDLPLIAHGHSSDSAVLLEVKIYDPWTK